MGRNGAVITERDRALLSFLGQHRIVLTSHIQVLLGVSGEAAGARLRSLRAAGLLTGERFFHRQSPCWSITRKGLAAIESDLPTPRIDLRSYRHDVGLAWVWLAAERGAFGQFRDVVSERTMRSSDGARPRAAATEEPAAEHFGPQAAATKEPAADSFGVRLGGVGPAGRERVHYPDLLLITADQARIAIELELTTKGRTRRERILAAYGADARIDAVLYLVDRAAVARSVAASAARLGVGSIVHVQRVHWGAGREVGLVAAQARRHSRRSLDAGNGAPYPPEHVWAMER